MNQVVSCNAEGPITGGRANSPDWFLTPQWCWSHPIRTTMPPPPPGRLVAQPPTKTIVVYRNGDAFFPGRKLVVKQRQVTTFDAFLTCLTSGLDAPFGAVRNVYTPRKGNKVSELEELRTGERYVAAGAERFKRLRY